MVKETYIISTDDPKAFTTSCSLQQLYIYNLFIQRDGYLLLCNSYLSLTTFILNETVSERGMR